MFETTPSARHRAAYIAAHKERARMFGHVWARLAHPFRGPQG